MDSRSVITTGPYMEQLFENRLPKKDVSGVYVFTMPLASGAMPFIHLDDIGRYVLWIFSHPKESIGINLKVSTDHVAGIDLVKAFTEVTGKPARFQDVSIEKYSEMGLGFANPDFKIGAQTQSPDDPTLISVKQSFSAWWRLYQNSGGNVGLIRTDYALLDRILPDRVRTVAEWMRKVGYEGERWSILKSRVDQ